MFLTKWIFWTTKELIKNGFMKDESSYKPFEIYKCKKCLTYTCDNMESGIVQVSSKGQMVIPAKIRKMMRLRIGDKLFAFGDRNTMVLKKISKPALEREFEEIVAPVRKKIKKLGVTRKALKKTIREVRG